MAYTDVSRDGASRCDPDGDWSEIIKEREDEPQLESSGFSEAWWNTDPAESSTEPRVGRVADGVANRIHRLKAIGNGQVPQCAAVAFNVLSSGLI